MPPWLEHLLSGLSPEGSAGGFLGSVATLIASVIVKVWFERRKLDKAMASVPPTVCPVPEPRPPTTPVASVLVDWTKDERIAELRARLATADHELQATRAELARTQLELVQANTRADASARERREMQHALDSGFTRLPPHVALTPVDVIEIDDRPTPRPGRRRDRP